MHSGLPDGSSDCTLAANADNDDCTEPPTAEEETTVAITAEEAEEKTATDATAETTEPSAAVDAETETVMSTTTTV